MNRTEVPMRQSKAKAGNKKNTEEKTLEEELKISTSFVWENTSNLNVGCSSQENG